MTNFENIKLALMAISIFLSSTVIGQTSGEFKYPRGFADVTNVVKIYSSNSCGSETFDIGGGKYRIKFISKIDDNIYLIEIVTNKPNIKSTDKYADVKYPYCISKADYENKFASNPPSNSRTAYGMLAVPFKLRFNPTTIAPGGELGGFYGWFLCNSNWLFVTHAGLTSIALNDVNAATPDNKLGFTGGIGFINDVGKNFQFGVVSGIDLFDGVDKWAYGYNPWISLQIGFKFTKSE
jgi:hypothetical protein